MLAVLLVSYPLLVHLSILIDRPKLQAASIICFCAGLLYQPLSHSRPGAWLLLLFASVVAILLAYWGSALWFLYLPPVLLPLMMLIIFGRSLRRGRLPLVTAIGEAARGPLSPAMRHYTRRVTQTWCLVFVYMSLVALILPWMGHEALWSWLSNVINYVLVIGLIIGEFILRKWLFPDHDHPGFFEFLRIVCSANIRP